MDGEAAGTGVRQQGTPRMGEGRRPSWEGPAPECTAAAERQLTLVKTPARGSHWLGGGVEMRGA